MAISTMGVRQLGLQPYQKVHRWMRAFTDNRNVNTVDEFWILQHEPVFTQGQAGKAEHILKESTISVVQSDRGGQITYHGPGQIILYTLMDLERRGINIHTLVRSLEQAIITLLANHGLLGEVQCGAPGVYIQGKKIASIGLRVRRGKSYHGLSFNVDMDLAPFSLIRPCGLQNIQMTQLSDHIGKARIDFSNIETQLIQCIADQFHFETLFTQNDWPSEIETPLSCSYSQKLSS